MFEDFTWRVSDCEEIERVSHSISLDKSRELS